MEKLVKLKRNSSRKTTHRLTNCLSASSALGAMLTTFPTAVSQETTQAAELKLGCRPRPQMTWRWASGDTMLSVRTHACLADSFRSFQVLLWWLSGKESTCQHRRQGFDLWSRKTPHAAEQLSLFAAATEPVLQRRRAAATEAWPLRDWAQQLQRRVTPAQHRGREKGPHSNKDPAQSKIKLFLQKERDQPYHWRK